MNLKKSVKYQVLDNKKAIIIFYIVMVSLTISTIILSFFANGTSTFGGIASASVIFLFVVGLNSFTECFKMFLQNGISRKEKWLSFIISSVITSASMSVIDLVLTFLSSLFVKTDNVFIELSSIYIGETNVFLNILNTFMLQVVFYTLALVLGYCIRLIYCRMNKAATITVSIAVPAFLFIGLPILDSFYELSPISESIIKPLASIMSPNNFYGLPAFYLFFIAITALLTLLNRQLIKKAIIK